MNLKINDMICLKDCRESIFLFQAFEIRNIEYYDFDKSLTLSKVKISLEKSTRNIFDTNLKKIS